MNKLEAKNQIGPQENDQKSMEKLLAIMEKKYQLKLKKFFLENANEALTLATDEKLPTKFVEEKQQELATLREKARKNHQVLQGLVGEN